MRGTVVTSQLTPGRGGKVSRRYLRVFGKELRKHGIAHREANTIEDLRAVDSPPEQTVVILVYNEPEIYSKAGYLAGVRALEDAAVEVVGAHRVLHPLRLGLAISDKCAANRWLSAAGIPMPRMLDAASAPSRAFSNLRCDTHRPVQLIEPGGELDSTRYNTEFIDTVHEYEGRRFFIALRAMCIGKRCIAIYVRARPVADGDPSVHSRDTPLDPAMINYFYRTIVLAQKAEIEAFCEKLGAVLGLGFYAHDILPEARSGKFYLSETGYKFDDRTLMLHLLPLRGQIAFGEELFEPSMRASAKAFLEEAHGLGLRPRAEKSPLRWLTRSIREVFGFRATSRA